MAVAVQYALPVPLRIAPEHILEPIDPADTDPIDVDQPFKNVAGVGGVFDSWEFQPIDCIPAFELHARSSFTRILFKLFECQYTRYGLFCQRRHPMPRAFLEQTLPSIPADLLLRNVTPARYAA
jgi:hypothetical protein